MDKKLGRQTGKALASVSKIIDKKVDEYEVKKKVKKVKKNLYGRVGISNTKLADKSIGTAAKIIATVGTGVQMAAVASTSAVLAVGTGTMYIVGKNVSPEKTDIVKTKAKEAVRATFETTKEFAKEARQSFKQERYRGKDYECNIDDDPILVEKYTAGESANMTNDNQNVPGQKKSEEKTEVFESSTKKPLSKGIDKIDTSRPQNDSNKPIVNSRKVKNEEIEKSLNFIDNGIKRFEKNIEEEENSSSYCSNNKNEEINPMVESLSSTENMDNINLLADFRD